MCPIFLFHIGFSNSDFKMPYKQNFINKAKIFIM